MNKALIYIPLLAVLLTTLNGCATTQTSASAIPGCGPSDITNSNYRTGWVNETWTAECKGRTYSCSMSAYGNVSCSPD